MKPLNTVCMCMVMGPRTGAWVVSRAFIPHKVTLLLPSAVTGSSNREDVMRLFSMNSGIVGALILCSHVHIVPTTEISVVRL